jgi:four helix bundle protein
MIAKLGDVEEEADESLYWMEMLVESELIKAAKLESLRKEGDEILAMVVASIVTLKKRLGPK